MKIAIIGAGVVGVTTAYKLAKIGHEVAVFDREPRAAMESSFANGGQLSYGFASPMGSPDLIGKIPAIMLGSDPAFRLPTTLSIDFLKWSVNFLAHCRSGQSSRDAAQLSLLAQQSGAAFQRILDETEFDFGHRQTSKLVLLKSEHALAKADQAIAQSDSSDRKAVLSWTSCLEHEPALHSYTGNAAGGLLIPGDAVGDAARFTEQMVAYCDQEFGVRFQFNSDVSHVNRHSGQLKEIVLATGEPVACDAVIVCTGVAGTNLLRDLDIRLPIFPVMGYSLTAPTGPHAPELAVTDAGYKIVFSRIGSHIRIAGFADFGIASEERRRQRIQDLIATARRLIPDVADYSKIQSTWIGARPATPSSLPIVKQSKVPGVYLNMGHGMFGWTLSAGAAQTLAELIGPATKISQAA